MAVAEVELLRAACCIAGLNEQVSERERPLLEEIAQRIGVGAASLQAMINRAERDEDFYKQQFNIVKPDAERAIQRLLEVAMASGEISQRQRVLLYHFAERLEVDPQHFEQLLKQAEQNAGKT